MAYGVPDRRIYQREDEQFERRIARMMRWNTIAVIVFLGATIIAQTVIYFKTKPTDYGREKRSQTNARIRPADKSKF